jgi:hypothetical protein
MRRCPMCETYRDGAIRAVFDCAVRSLFVSLLGPPQPVLCV